MAFRHACAAAAVLWMARRIYLGVPDGNEEEPETKPPQPKDASHPAYSKENSTTDSSFSTAATLPGSSAEFSLPTTHAASRLSSCEKMNSPFCTNKLLMDGISSDESRLAHQVELSLDEELSPAENASNLLFNVLRRHAHLLPDLDRASLVYAGKTLLKNGAPASLVPVALQARRAQPLLLVSRAASQESAHAAHSSCVHTSVRRSLSDCPTVDTEERDHMLRPRSDGFIGNEAHTAPAPFQRMHTSCAPHSQNLWEGGRGGDVQEDQLTPISRERSLPLATGYEDSGLEQNGHEAVMRQRSRSMVVPNSNSLENADEVALVIHAWLRDQYSPATPVSRIVGKVHGGRSHGQRQASMEDISVHVKGTDTEMHGSGEESGGSKVARQRARSNSMLEMPRSNSMLEMSRRQDMNHPPHPGGEDTPHPNVLLSEFPRRWMRGASMKNLLPTSPGSIEKILPATHTTPQAHQGGQGKIPSRRLLPVPLSLSPPLLPEGEAQGMEIKDWSSIAQCFSGAACSAADSHPSTPHNGTADPQHGGSGSNGGEAAEPGGKLFAALDSPMPADRGRRSSMDGVHENDVTIYVASAQEQCEIDSAMEDVEEWSFDVFLLDHASKGHPLQVLGWHVLQHWDLVQQFGLSEHKVRKWLGWVEANYTSTPYHNKVHATDVTQSVFYLLTTGGLEGYLDDLHILSLLLSAMVHDIGHDGFNNAYHKNAATSRADTFNDQSIQENFHLQLILNGMKTQSSINILAELPAMQGAMIRDLMIDLILATDMSKHFNEVRAFKDLACEFGNTSPEPWLEHQAALMIMALHMSDISNPAKPRNLALRWTDMILSEFFVQGDVEKMRGLTVSPMCNRDTTLTAASQIGFIKFIVLPSLQTLATMLPVLETTCLPQLENNFIYWQDRAESEAAFVVSLLPRPSSVPMVLQVKSLPMVMEVMESLPIVMEVKADRLASVDAHTQPHNLCAGGAFV
mmetsp:Transcript_73194/g.107416  ORF Transcript_73194/g.107416 Transcript_73194/m.107416 type:complete len:971 (+) Transcript_73194:93-3005(+)